MTSYPAPRDATRAIDLPPDRLIALGTAFWAAKALLSAVELRLFSTLVRGSLDAEALTERIGIHPRGARDLFDGLVALGVLDRQNAHYLNAPEADLFLDEAKPTYIGGLLMMLSTRLYPAWGRLTDALRSGRAQVETADGADPYATLYADPERLARFAQAMSCISMAAASTIAERFPWRRYRRFVDVGCAEGAFGVRVASAHSHLSGIGLDLPPLRPFFETYVRRAGLSDRLTFAASDFFRDPLPGADVVVLGHVLHNWDREQKRGLLAKAYQAVATGGALIVYDALIDDERRQNAAGLLMSLNMLVETPGGFDYTATEGLSWLEAAGFRDLRREPLSGWETMLVGMK